MLSGDEILIEFAKGLDDPTYIIENYLKTFDKTQEGYVPFKLFPRQKEIITAYINFRFNIVAKPRQAGVSTTTAAYVSVIGAWADHENPEKILILANKQTLAQEFLAKIRDFLVQLPRWVWGPEYYGSEENEKKSIFLTDSKGHLVVPNGTQFRALATSKDALRGFTPTFLIMDEAAFIDNGAEVFGAALTALGTGGRCCLLSTPRGYDPLYWKTYDGAKKKENDFNIIEMRWYEDLRYNKDLTWWKKKEDSDDIIKEKEIEFNFLSYKKRIDEGWKPTSSWYEEMCRAMNNDKRMIAQELDVSFLGSGGNVIDEEYIVYQEKNNCIDPKWVSGPDQEFWIWEKPIEGHQYILAGDVASGSGEDSSTIIVVDFTTMEQVMEYKGKVQPDLLAQIIEEYGNLYNAYVVVDNIGIGTSTVLKLLEFGYKNLHYDDPRSNVLKENKDLGQYVRNGKIPGFNAQSVRLPMIANLEYAVRMNSIKIRSIRLTSEMRTFVYRNGRPDHMSGCHDDLIMCMAMILWVLEHSFKKLEKLEKQTKAMLNSWISSDNLSDKEKSGFVPKGKSESTGKPKFNPQISKNMQDPRGDYLWLFSGMR